MRWNMKRIVFAVIASFVLLLASCAAKAPPKLDSTAQTDSTEYSETTAESDEITAADYSEKIAALLSDKTGFVSKSIPLDRRYSAFTYKNKLYLYLNYHLYEMNFVTGKLQRICRDPLCKHNIEETCVDNPYYLSFYVDNGYNQRTLQIFD